MVTIQQEERFLSGHFEGGRKVRSAYGNGEYFSITRIASISRAVKSEEGNLGFPNRGAERYGFREDQKGWSKESEI